MPARVADEGARVPRVADEGARVPRVADEGVRVPRQNSEITIIIKEANSRNTGTPARTAGQSDETNASRYSIKQQQL